MRRDAAAACDANCSHVRSGCSSGEQASYEARSTRPARSSAACVRRRRQHSPLAVTRTAERMLRLQARRRKHVGHGLHPVRRVDAGLSGHVTAEREPGCCSARPCAAGRAAAAVAARRRGTAHPRHRRSVQGHAQRSRRGGRTRPLRAAGERHPCTIRRLLSALCAAAGACTAALVDSTSAG